MDQNDEVVRLLTEMRDGQRESINEYKRLQESYDARFQGLIRRQQTHLAIFAVLVFILGLIVAAEVFVPRQQTSAPTPPIIVLPNSSSPIKKLPSD